MADNSWLIEIDCDATKTSARWGAEIRNPNGEVFPTVEAPTALALCAELASVLSQNEGTA